MRWWLLPALALLLAPTVTPTSACGAALDEPFEAAWWVSPGYGRSVSFDVPTGGYLVVEAMSPPGRTPETMTLWVSKTNPGAYHSIDLGEMMLTEQPVTARYPIEPGRYSVGVLMSNRHYHPKYGNDPVFARLAQVTVRHEAP